MTPITSPSASPGLLAKSSFQRFIDALMAGGYRVMGQRLCDGAVKWDDVRLVSDLPIGWRDAQEPGRYRLEPTDSGRFFEVVNGPESVKRFAFAPREPLLVIERSSKSFQATPTLPKGEKTALLGVRACDLAGLAVQDRVFLRDAYPDPYYRTRRADLFLVAVNCARALPTCFCASLNTGPKAQAGFDLALTELDDAFLIEAGSQAGRELMPRLPLAPAPEQFLAEAEAQAEACANSQTRRVETAQLPQALYDAHEHPRWDQVAARCLACGNCTMVCPTCFCHAVEDVPDLNGQRAEQARVWDSCFTQEHGYIHGKNIRPAVKDRYRMWLTHKLASWIDQFGTSGCVGCGRCITWCPVGIDLTEELPALLKKA
ncbi:MAG: sulfite reductase subunit A [Nitrospira sp.]|nr:sulfite reductase subunit A [Nitrospira sp.]